MAVLFQTSTTSIAGAQARTQALCVTEFPPNALKPGRFDSLCVSKHAIACTDTGRFTQSF
jgi:hypothetical protein